MLDICPLPTASQLSQHCLSRERERGGKHWYFLFKKIHIYLTVLHCHFMHPNPQWNCGKNIFNGTAFQKVWKVLKDNIAHMLCFKKKWALLSVCAALSSVNSLSYEKDRSGMCVCLHKEKWLGTFCRIRGVSHLCSPSIFKQPSLMSILEPLPKS